MIIAFLYAIMGGLILNLMPCVLPVLSMKIISITKMGKSNKSLMIKSALSYTAGVSLCMFCFSSILMLLRGYFETKVAWGYQMQSPIFVSLMIYLIFTIGLSMSGAFEFHSLNSSLNSNSNSVVYENFFTGLFCVLLSTPCFAPFMGSAISAALANTNIFASFFIFQGLALGLSLPYLIIALVPKLISFLPQPGPWMEIFKNGLAFPMYTTSAWLLWVLNGLSGAEAVFLTLLGLIAIAFSIWIWSLIKTKGIIVKYLSLILIIFLISLPIIKIPNSINTEENKKIVFNKDIIHKLQTQKKSFLVSIGADWCLMCKVNEQIIDSDEIQSFLNKKGIIQIQGDLTKKSTDIQAYLHEFRTSGIPFYVLYVNGKKPKIMPQILTKQLIRNEIIKLQN